MFRQTRCNKMPKDCCGQMPIMPLDSANNACVDKKVYDCGGDQQVIQHQHVVKHRHDIVNEYDVVHEYDINHYDVVKHRDVVRTNDYTSHQPNYCACGCEGRAEYPRRDSGCGCRRRNW